MKRLVFFYGSYRSLGKQVNLTFITVHHAPWMTGGSQTIDHGSR